MRHTYPTALISLICTTAVLGACHAEPLALNAARDAPNADADALRVAATPRLDLLGTGRWRTTTGAAPRPDDFEHVVPLVDPGWTPDEPVPLWATPPSAAAHDLDAWRAQLQRDLQAGPITARVMFRAEPGSYVRWQKAIDAACTAHGLQSAERAPVILWPAPPPPSASDALVPILALLGMAALVAITLLLVRSMNAARRDAVSAMLETAQPALAGLGLPCERRSGLLTHEALLRGDVPGGTLRVRFGILTGWIASYATPSISLILTFTSPLPFALNLQPRGLLPRASDAKTGDDLFDEAFALQTNAPAQATGALSAEVRQALLAIQALGGQVALTQDALSWQGDESAARNLPDLLRHALAITSALHELHTL